MIKVWGRRTSSNVQAVMWAIGELELAHERYDFGHRYGGVDTPEFLAMNPNGMVPVVRDGDGEFLWESCGDPALSRQSLWPRAFLARRSRHANPHRQMGGMVEDQFRPQFLRSDFWQVVRTPAERRNPAALKRALGVLDRYLDIGETQLAKARFLCGEDFTLADVQFGHLLYRYFDIDIERRERGRLRAYYEQLVDAPRLSPACHDFL